ncbi:M50 family metallopeptidase [Demetria terragena]|uniref:M50 family metallopeptidase n=1 Tax=Demetria terragena TaxID=63959 RepID=UPI000361565C|nr:M50 family metallopeptidase [Demetria terragena]
MDEFWQRLTNTAPPLDRVLVVLLAVLALGLIAWQPSWRVLRQVVTIAHEGAHALVAVLCGRRLTGIRLHSDTSGVTVSRGLARGPGMVVTLAVGYVGPALLALFGAGLIHQDRPVLFLWLLLLVLALMLVQIRNWFGVVAVLASAAVLVAVTRYLPVEGQTMIAYLLVWFLLLAAPRAVGDLHTAHRRGRGWDSDAGQLSRLTPLPATAWIAIFFLSTLGSLALGAWLLLGSL